MNNVHVIDFNRPTAGSQEPSGGGAAKHGGEAPRFTKSMTGVETVRDSKAVFEVGIRAQPQPDVVWFHNGELVQPGADYQVMYMANTCCFMFLLN